MAKKTLEEVNSELKQELEVLTDKYLRQAAEFDNYRKRVQKEKSGLIKSAGEGVIVDLLEILDDFDRSISVSSDSWGFELISRKFKKILERNGLKEIQVIPLEPFNPDFHEAVSLIPAQKPEDSGMVVDVIQRGYILGDKIIRYPKVIVAQ